MRTWHWVLIIFIIVIVGSLGFLMIVEPQYAYTPDEDEIMNADRTEVGQGTSFDVWGETVTPEKAAQLHSEGLTDQLKAENGAVEVNEEVVDFGRQVFYEETFDNEVYITDILGMLDGPLRLTNITKAIKDLDDGYTNNLRVELAEDIKIGDKTYKKGEKIDTGLDVPKGSMTPLGMPISFSEGRIKTGVSCAACHATVDRKTGKIIEGAPNADFNAGLMLAMATNSAAYFTNTDIDKKKIEAFIRDTERTVETTDGNKEPLPDPELLEKAVDETLAKWPKGNFDSTIDLESNPSQIPDSFTLGDHPYGWNGFASIGPFKGLSSLNNNVHAQNSDLLAQADQSQELFDIDKELYIATMLQNAANEKYRYDYESGEKPSDFMAEIDDEPDVPGVNDMVKPPTFPKISIFTPNGTVIGTPGTFFAEQINAMSAYQNALKPAKYESNASEETIETGRKVFHEAGCISCHAGRAYTNNQIIDVDDLNTQPSRAKAFKDAVKLMEEPRLYSFDTPIPIPDDAKVLKVPTDHIDEQQKNLILAQDENSSGGYKVKGLIGLAWSAPYLHDGGVAVGANEKDHLGIPGTLDQGVKPDPYNSLKALVDEELREKVMEENKKSADLQDINVDGSGHEHWVDESTGFTKEEQEALIEFLLSATSNEF